MASGVGLFVTLCTYPQMPTATPLRSDHFRNLLTHLFFRFSEFRGIFAL
jgi:hypothetical protein